MGIKENIYSVINDIENSSQKTKDEIILIAVTKTVDIPAIKEAIEMGITHIGENKPQEIVRKYDLIGNSVKWHLIGTLQTNKVKYIIDKVDMIHSLDRLSLAEEIDKRAKQINKVMNCLIQVNISKEDSKHGILEEDAIDLIQSISKKCKNIRVCGLMTMAPFHLNNEECRIHFKNLKSLSNVVKNLEIDNTNMKYLSMGMSNDFKVAIQEGANMVRVGSAIFGERNY